jgi:hypothetical protein
MHDNVVVIDRCLEYVFLTFVSRHCLPASASVAGELLLFVSLSFFPPFRLLLGRSIADGWIPRASGHEIIIGHLSQTPQSQQMPFPAPSDLTRPAAD